MKKTVIAALTLGAWLACAAPAHAQPAQGDQCYNWHATAQDASGRTLTCTHLPQSAPGGGSGHIMYWELGGAQDSVYHSSGFKTDPTPTPGHIGPCDSRAVRVSKIDPQTGNAIQVWGPPGCDPSLPMTGGN